MRCSLQRCSQVDLSLRSGNRSIYDIVVPEPAEDGIQVIGSVQGAPATARHVRPSSSKLPPVAVEDDDICVIAPAENHRDEAAVPFTNGQLTAIRSLLRQHPLEPELNVTVRT